MPENPQIIPNYDQTDCPLSAGEFVEHSGIYEICHFDEPRTTVLLTRHTIFPYCKRCGDRVRYKLLQAAPHISEDPDFLEDFTGTDNPKFKMAVPETRFPLQLGIAHGFRFWKDLLQTRRSCPEIGDLSSAAQESS